MQPFFRLFQFQLSDSDQLFFRHRHSHARTARYAGQLFLVQLDDSCDAWLQDAYVCPVMSDSSFIIAVLDVEYKEILATGISSVDAVSLLWTGSCQKAVMQWRRIA